MKERRKEGKKLINRESEKEEDNIGGQREEKKDNKEERIRGKYEGEKKVSEGMKDERKEENKKGI